MKLKEIFEHTLCEMNDEDIQDVERRASRLGFARSEDSGALLFSSTIKTDRGDLDVRYRVNPETESWTCDISRSEQDDFITIQSGEDSNGMIAHMGKSLRSSQIDRAFES